jgi:hypothetical protein
LVIKPSSISYGPDGGFKFNDDDFILFTILADDGVVQEGGQYSIQVYGKTTRSDICQEEDLVNYIKTILNKLFNIKVLSL